jgi:hypothetical protein
MIKRVDGSIIDFSWVYCCKFKKQTSSENLTIAMRQAIKDVVINYKRNNELMCNNCNVKNELYEDYHVDHNIIPFKTIKNDFLQQTTLEIPTYFDDCEYSNQPIFKEEDYDFKNEWINYHNTNCHLQILCRHCNLTKK